MADYTLLDAGVIDADPDTFSLDTQPVPYEKRIIQLTVSTSADRAGALMDFIGKDGDDDAIKEINMDISSAHSTPVETVLKYKTVDASGVTVRGMTNDDTVTIIHEVQGFYPRLRKRYLWVVED